MGFASGQTLVRWDNANFTPNIINTEKVAAQNIIATVGLDVLKWEDSFFNTSGWPKPNYQNSNQPIIDETKYVQFEISPKIDNQIEMKSFDISYRSQGTAKFYIKYSLNKDFSNSKSLIPSTDINDTKWHNVSLTDFSKLPLQIVSSGKTLYLRVYVYNTENEFHLKFDSAKKEGPLFTGLVRQQTNVAPTAFEDIASVSKNNEVTIDVLENDYFQASPKVNISNQPNNGAVVVNQQNQVVYTPRINFVGQDIFYYTVTTAGSTSQITKVTVTVTDDIVLDLIRWNKSNYTATLASDALANIPMKNVGLSLGAETWETPLYIIGGLTAPSTNQVYDANKYIQFNIESNSTSKQMTLSNFEFEYKGNGNVGKFVIKYSKDPLFKTNVYTLSDVISYDANWTKKALQFNNDALINPGDKLYIRLYPYASNSQMLIKFNSEKNEGPVVKAAVFSNYITTWTSAMTWDNGMPNSLKRAVIASNYNTQKDGNIEAYDLLIKQSASVTVFADTFVKLIDKFANEGDENTFVIQSDGDLLQVNNVVNTGKITVKRSTRLPMMGYNYWSAPVTGQNLYQFSDGYNQAAPPVNPQGTPWKNFFIYNEANNYFVTSLPNEMTLNAASEFQTGRGYAIRGKNSFPKTIAEKTLPSDFQFVGVPNNGDLQSQNLKWTNASRGYNMVGNPYPSNVDMDKFFDANKDIIEPKVYFWTNNDMSLLTQQGGSYSGNNYAIYNRVGGIAATFSGVNKAKPKQAVKVGQGFIVRTKASGKDKPLVFNNEMRTSENGVFFNYKMAQKDRFWINLNSPSDINNEILVAYLPDATNDIDRDYDAELLSVGNDAIWTNVNNLKLGIQARASFNDTSDVVSLGVKFSESGDFTISINDKEGQFQSEQVIYLKDKSNATITEISKYPYTFYANKGTETNRFEIIYQPEKTLSTENISKETISIYQHQDHIIVKSSEVINNVQLYDTLGRMVFTINSNQKDIAINAASFNAGMYIIKVNTVNNFVTKKLLK